MKQVGIIDMEIYIDGTTLFMMMVTVPDFCVKAMSVFATLPRQGKWEHSWPKIPELDSTSGALDRGKWKLMERIYKMD